MFITIIVIAKECLRKGNQFLLFLLLRKQGKLVNTMMIYTVHGAPDIKHFDVHYNYSYSKGMTSERKPIPPVPPAKKAR